MSRSELLFIDEVIDDCCQIIRRITAWAHSLCYSPIRILSRMIRSSIFLLKALALGTRHGKVQEALSVLDKAVAALRDTHLDDTHLATSYGELLGIQVSRLRGSLLRASPMNVDEEPCEIDRQAAVSNGGQDTGPGGSAWEDNQNMANIDFGLPPDFDNTDWLSLSFEPSMAPFENWDEQLGASLEAVDSSLDFIWNLPPSS
ncbi:hypothetical protein Plec18170_004510 [Paecilomyces lecythidis]